MSDKVHRHFQENVHKLQYGIVSAKLDVAITFCKVASSAANPERFDQNLANAVNAHEAAMVLLDETDLTIFESAAIQEQLNEFDEWIEQLKYGRCHPRPGDVADTPAPPPHDLASRTRIPRCRARLHP